MKKNEAMTIQETLRGLNDPQIPKATEDDLTQRLKELLKPLTSGPAERLLEDTDSDKGWLIAISMKDSPLSAEAIKTICLRKRQKAFLLAAKASKKLSDKDLQEIEDVSK